jgi:hypothetical protein
VVGRGGLDVGKRDHRVDHIVCECTALNEELVGGEDSVGPLLPAQAPLFVVVSASIHFPDTSQDIHPRLGVDGKQIQYPAFGGTSLMIANPPSVSTGNKHCKERVEGSGCSGRLRRGCYQRHQCTMCVKRRHDIEWSCHETSSACVLTLQGKQYNKGRKPGAVWVACTTTISIAAPVVLSFGACFHHHSQSL